MGKSLVIVESPSKASIINRYLGSDYIVKASVGHIRDLATVVPQTKDKTKKVYTKGIDYSDFVFSRKFNIDLLFLESSKSSSKVKQLNLVI